jgi:hypothetical protein
MWTNWTQKMAWAVKPSLQAGYLTGQTIFLDGGMTAA